MRIIAHRANINGPDKDNENSPAQILRAIDSGFDVEIDVRIVDGQILFGHEVMTYHNMCVQKNY
ncbi:MAG: hypothetical protein EBV27_03855 [Actinobacteria bacterium]|nr:hypothetical protein [Actinomycetota bacterium]